MDTSRDAPTSGSHRGVDRAGLFRPMACAPVGEMASPFAVTSNYVVSLILDEWEAEGGEAQRVADLGLDKERLHDPWWASSSGPGRSTGRRRRSYC